MPVYEYECQQCGDRIEELQKLNDPPLKKHDGCGGRLKRLLSAPAIQFKGSGWYITDYARKGQSDGDGKKRDTAEAKADAKADAKKSGAGDKDTAATTTSKKETKS